MNKIIKAKSDATYKAYEFEILKIGVYESGANFYMVRDIKARKFRFQLIELQKNDWFHSLGRVKTIEEAEEWFETKNKAI